MCACMSVYVCMYVRVCVCVGVVAAVEGVLEGRWEQLSSQQLADVLWSNAKLGNRCSHNRQLADLYFTRLFGDVSTSTSTSTSTSDISSNSNNNSNRQGMVVGSSEAVRFVSQILWSLAVLQLVTVHVSILYYSILFHHYYCTVDKQMYKYMHAYIHKHIHMHEFKHTHLNLPVLL